MTQPAAASARLRHLLLARPRRRLRRRSFSADWQSPSAGRPTRSAGSRRARHAVRRLFSTCHTPPALRLPAPRESPDWHRPLSCLRLRSPGWRGCSSRWRRTPRRTWSGKPSTAKSSQRCTPSSAATPPRTATRRAACLPRPRARWIRLRTSRRQLRTPRAASPPSKTSSGSRASAGRVTTSAQRRGPPPLS